MNAFVKNKSEAELLKIFKEVALLLELDFDFEIEAIEPGGIKEIFKLLDKKKYKKLTNKFLISIGMIILGVIIEITVDGITKNSELDELQKEKTKLES